MNVIREESWPLCKTLSHFVFGSVACDADEYNHVYGLMKEHIKVLNNTLKARTFLVGDALTVADLQLPWPAKSCHAETPLHAAHAVCPAVAANVPGAHAPHDGLEPDASAAVGVARNWPIAQLSQVPAADPPHVVWYWPPGQL